MQEEKGEKTRIQRLVMFRVSTPERLITLPAQHRHCAFTFVRLDVCQNQSVPNQVHRDGLTGKHLSLGPMKPFRVTIARQAREITSGAFLHSAFVGASLE